MFSARPLSANSRLQSPVDECVDTTIIVVGQEGSTYTKMPRIYRQHPVFNAVDPVALAPAAQLLEVRVLGPGPDGPDEALFDYVDETCGC